jgi:hypothetical protein
MEHSAAVGSQEPWEEEQQRYYWIQHVAHQVTESVAK